MKILTCFLAPTAGSAKVAGYDVFDESLEVRRRIGYLPEDTPLYRDMTVLEYLEFAADMRGMDAATGSRRASRRSAAAAASPTSPASWSASCPRATASASAWRRPCCTTPTSSSSTSRRAASTPTRSSRSAPLIKEIGQEKTVILSTHILPEVQATCSRILIISGGKLVADGTPDELRAREKAHAATAWSSRPNGAAAEAIRDQARRAWPAWSGCETVAGEDGAHAFAIDGDGRRATCASRSSAPPSTTTGRCSS